MRAATTFSQEHAQRLEVGPLARGQRARERVKVQKVNVEVAGGSGDFLQPPELGPEARQFMLWEHASEFTLQRSGASDGDAEVM